MKELYYCLIGIGVGFTAAALLSSEKINDLERENIHLEFEKQMLEKKLNPAKLS